MDEYETGGWDSGGLAGEILGMAKTMLGYKYALKSQQIQSGIDATKKVVDGTQTQDGKLVSKGVESNTLLWVAGGAVVVLVLVLAIRK